MDDKVKDTLGKLFAQDRERKEQVAARENQREQDEASRLEQFNKLRDEIIQPALEEIAEFVRQQGWSAEVHFQEEKARTDRGRATGSFDPPRIGIFFARTGNPRWWSHETPHFSVIANKREGSVNFHASTIGEGHGGSSGGQGSVAIGELTKEFLQERVTAYLEKLMRDSAPYPRH